MFYSILLYYLIMLNCFSKAEQFLINTPGCKIPDYDLRIPEKVMKISCGERKVFAEKINDYEAKFIITDNLENCCYRFIKTEFYTDFYPPHGVEYTPCNPLADGQTIKLKSDFVSVKCKGYSDLYAFTKKISNKEHRAKTRHHWNVIVLGLDRTSRTRAYRSLKGTVRYLNTDNWLDFKGYNKLASNTYPNLVQLLSGMNESAFDKACHLGMSACNHLMIWSKYKKAGYVTAYGEDSVYYPDTFHKRKGHAKAPTDHFMRPLFKAGEKKHKNNIVCCTKISSGEHILNYILDFVETYKNEKFFGFFWISSFSHDYNQFLRNYDALLETFFRTLPEVENTFIILLSDHGLRFGSQKWNVESFYEDKLPMLFIKPPTNLKITFPYLYSNLEINQHRLLSPKDLHLTLANLVNSKNGYINHPKIKGCPKCQSLLQKIPARRTCSDAGIPDYFCACRDLKPTTMEEYGVMYSVIQLFERVQNKSQTARTTRCNYCTRFTFNKAWRTHYFVQKNTTFYLLAFTVTPGNIGFEGMVTKNEVSGRYQYKVLEPINLITRWQGNGYCAVHRADRTFCVCKKKTGCMPRTKKVKVGYKRLKNNIWSEPMMPARKIFIVPATEKLPELQPLRRKAKKNKKFMPLLHFDDIDEQEKTQKPKYPVEDPRRYIHEHFPMYVYPPHK